MSTEEKESYLTDDPEIASQRWCLLSFISPENVLNRKEQFLFTSFLNQYEFTLRTKKMEEYFVKQIQAINSKLMPKRLVLRVWISVERQPPAGTPRSPLSPLLLSFRSL